MASIEDDDSVKIEDLFIENAVVDEDEEVLSGDRVEQIDAAWNDLAVDLHAECPGLKDWEEVPCEIVTVGLGQASSDIWEQTKSEIQCARCAFEKLCGSPSPSINELVVFFLGSESELFRVIKDNLGWSYDEWSGFIKTFCLQSLYKLSVTNLYEADGYIQQEALLPKDQYVSKWKVLGTACLSNDERAAPASAETLWMKVEGAVNSMFRRFVVEPWIDPDDSKRIETVEVVYDDNKMWHDARASDAHLNMVQHVRDNQRGPVHHDAVASATGMIAGFRFERKKDTSVSTMKAITRQQFVPAQGGTELRHLNWLFAKGDRAYTMKEGLYGFLLPSGARARGTKKRTKEWPHCYGFDLKEGDGRTDIPTAGSKSMWVKSTTVNGRKLYAIAYRNGNGGVTLGASTEADDVYHWDLTLQNPADREWFYKLSAGRVSQLDCLRRAFRPLDANSKIDVISEDFASLLADRPILPLTMGQSKDYAWWICRMFSQSSTSADKGFAIFDGSESDLRHQAAWLIAKSYLSKSGSRSWNTVKQEEAQEQAAALEEEESKEENENDGTNAADDDFIAAIDTARLKSDDEYAAMLAAAIDPDSDEDDRIVVDIDAVRAALVAEGASLSRHATDFGRQSADNKKFRHWCCEHSFLRPHFLKKNAALLKQLASSLSPLCVLDESTTTPTSIYNSIKAHLQQHPDAILANQSSGATNTTPVLLSKPQKLLHAVLSAAFLKKQTGDNRENTRRGLDLEAVFARKLLEDSRKNRTAGFIVHEIASVPVVERTGISHRSAIASTDFVASIESPGSTRGRELAVIEMKARVSEGTAQKERIIQGLAKLRMIASNGLLDHSRRYYTIKAEDECFSHFIDARKEALQLLHHAYVYDLNWVLLMIGDNYGRIIAGVWIYYDSSLKAAWGEVLEDMYRLSIAFLYSNLQAVGFQLTEEETTTLAPVMESIKVASGKLDIHSFRQMVMIWRVIRLRWPKLLPMANKLLPFIFSSWNSAKGGSDTITKMLWSVKSEPPNRHPQAHAIGRMLQIIFIQIYRSLHIATSKIGLPYKSLLHYRNAANKRSSLHRTLIAISHCFDCGTTNTPRTPRRVTILPQQTQPPELVGRSLRGAKPKLKLHAHAVPITGSTPQRGIRKKLNQLLDGYISLKQNQQQVVNRVRKCTGIPAYRNVKGLCIVCAKETYWYCIGCHVCLCMTDVSKAKNADEFDCFEMEVTIPALSNSGAKAKSFEVSNKCYLQHHRSAVFNFIGANSSL